MSSSSASAEPTPTQMVRTRASSTNWPKLCTGLPTLTTPTISSFQRIGAPTYITEVRGSPSTSREVRAPYRPPSVRFTSLHCE
ncbi:hypothetical protein FQZ97_827150 [compost metagenome]